jgi:hypothetical protein
VNQRTPQEAETGAAPSREMEVDDSDDDEGRRGVGSLVKSRRTSGASTASDEQGDPLGGMGFPSDEVAC